MRIFGLRVEAELHWIEHERGREGLVGRQSRDRLGAQRQDARSSFSTSHQPQRRGMEPLTGSAADVSITRLMLAASRRLAS
jgi:hypothetical protein